MTKRQQPANSAVRHRPRLAGHCLGRRRERGFTLLELMIALVIVGILATIAVESYQYAQDKANIAQAKADIATISTTLERYYTTNGTYPDSLADIGLGAMLDPWGNPYQYVSMASKNAQGKCRRNKKDNPINTDFDLYSKGKDGESKKQVYLGESLDDIIRARNGAFIGLGADY